jgi:uncharacterized protein (TIGR02678 family)
MTTVTDTAASAPSAEIEQPLRRPKKWTPDVGLEVADVLRLLMVRPWLYAGRDDEDIAKVRRNRGAIVDIFSRLGWVLVVDRDFVRLRKSAPLRSAVFASGPETPSALACQWFFLLAAAAESMGRWVPLGTLVSAARSAAAEAETETNGDIAERRAIVRALRMLNDRGVIEDLDNNLDTYVSDERAPIGLAIHHTRLIHLIANFDTQHDPVSDPVAWIGALHEEEAREEARSVSRRLLDDSLVHVGDLSEKEADWLSRRLRDYVGPLAEAFGLHIERRTEGAAVVVPESAFRAPRELGPVTFPGKGTAAHAALFVCAWACEAGDIDAGDASGWRVLRRAAVVAELKRLAALQIAGKGGWRRELAEDPGGALLSEVRDILCGLDLVRVEGDLWYFSPAIDRWETPAAPEPGPADAAPDADAPGAELAIRSAEGVAAELGEAS